MRSTARLWPLGIALALAWAGCQVPPLEQVADGKSCDEDAGHPCAPGYRCCRGGCIPEEQSCCLPEDDAAFCARLGKTCDPVSGTDNCGATRTAHCGACASGTTCGGGGLPNACGSGGCASETNAVFCARLGKTCGTVTANDNCGLSRTIVCGTCLAPDTCQPDNTCTCSAETDAQFCARSGKQCGPYTNADACGLARTADCGACTTAPNLTCQGNACVCVPDTASQLCARLGVQCGTATGMDNCGTTRTVTCPQCTSPQTCGGGGAAGQCGCVAVGATGCGTGGAVCCDGACGGTAPAHCCLSIGAPCVGGINGECCTGSCGAITNTCCRTTGNCTFDEQCCTGVCDLNQFKCVAP